MKTLEVIKEINAGFPYLAPVREWKGQGKKVVAFQCAYVPEEVIWAAGILPVRMSGHLYKELKLDDATAYLYINVCSFCRSCFQLALEGQWDFLDGYVTSGNCDCSRRLADVWQMYIPIPVIYNLSTPRTITEETHQYYLSEVQEFKQRLENFFKIRITDEALWDAIGLYNRMRQLLSEIQGLRRLDNPPISGPEMMEVLNAGQRMPRDTFVQFLERLLLEAKVTSRQVDGRARVMVIGSPLNNPGFLKAMEDQGGLVVADATCMASYWEDLVDTSFSNPLEAISRRTLSEFPCARMIPYHDRLKRLVELVKDYRVNAVVTHTTRYCDNNGDDLPLVRLGLEEAGVRVLELDVEYGMGETGQIKTRVQAFMEMLAPG